MSRILLDFLTLTPLLVPASHSHHCLFLPPTHTTSPFLLRNPIEFTEAIQQQPLEKRRSWLYSNLKSDTPLVRCIHIRLETVNKDSSIVYFPAMKLTNVSLDFGVFLAMHERVCLLSLR